MRIHEVIIAVGDVEEATSFYTKVVGLKHVRTVEHDGHELVELDAEGQRVTLVPGDAPAVTLAFDADSVTSRSKRLSRNDVEVDEGLPVEIPGGAWLPFQDPWGNPLGFWEDRSPDLPPE